MVNSYDEKKEERLNRRRRRSDRIYSVVVMFFVTLLFLIVLLPLLNIVASSFSSVKSIQQGKVLLWPVNFSLDGYQAVFKDKDLVRGYINSIYLTVVGTLVNVIVIFICAYPMSRTTLPGRKFFTIFFTFTMFFGGGMIPSYILIRDLHMIDSYAALILPGALSVYNMIIVRTYMQNSIPFSLFEASRIDGCSEFQYFLKILLPLSKPVIAVITLYCALGHWNQFFSALIYINDNRKMPLQVVLRQILVNNTVDASMIVDDTLLEKKEGLADLMKYSLIIVASVPMLVIYPFVQKHFVKGVMVGSIKG